MFALVLFMSLLAVQEVSAANLAWVSTPAVVPGDTASAINIDSNTLTGDYNFNGKYAKTNQVTHTWVFSVSPTNLVSTFFSVLFTSNSGSIASVTLDGMGIGNTQTVLLSSAVNHTLVIVMKNITHGTHEQLTIKAAVPVPAAIWLFGSALVGLVGVSRRKVGLAA